MKTVSRWVWSNAVWKCDFFCETQHVLGINVFFTMSFLPWKDFPLLLSLSVGTINFQMLLARVLGPFLFLLQSLKQIILHFGSAQWREKMSSSDFLKDSQENGRCVGRSACPGLFVQQRRKAFHGYWIRHPHSWCRFPQSIRAVVSTVPWVEEVILLFEKETTQGAFTT